VGVDRRHLGTRVPQELPHDVEAHTLLNQVRCERVAEQVTGHLEAGALLEPRDPTAQRVLERSARLVREDVAPSPRLPIEDLTELGMHGDGSLPLPLR